MSLDDSILTKYLNFARLLAIESGKIVLDAQSKQKDVHIKSVAIDLVTDTDRSVEAFIFDTIRNTYPDHLMIGEESSLATQHLELASVPTWIIDPIDGTMNFVHGFPFFCISIGLAIEKQIVVGVIYNPLLNQMYYAAKNQGSYMNHTRIRVSKETELAKALLLTEYSHDMQPLTIANKIENLQLLLNIPVHAIRSLGSCAWNMCQVAAGAADGYFEFGIHCWDCAAGIIIITEAGGIVADPSFVQQSADNKPKLLLDNSFDLFGRKLVCTGTKDLAAALLFVLQTNVPLKRD